MGIFFRGVFLVIRVDQVLSRGTFTCWASEMSLLRVGYQVVKDSKGLQEPFSAVTALKGFLHGVDTMLWLMTVAGEGWLVLKAPIHLPITEGSWRLEQACSGLVGTLLSTCAKLLSHMDSRILHLLGRRFLILHSTQATFVSSCGQGPGLG